MSVGLCPTGRNCEGNKRTGRSCRGKLRDATLDWDTEISLNHLDRIRKAWKQTSHLLCIGTSLEIIPMGSLPLDAKSKGIKTTTINYQETAHVCSFFHSQSFRCGDRDFTLKYADLS